MSHWGDLQADRRCLYTQGYDGLYFIAEVQLSMLLWSVSALSMASNEDPFSFNPPH